MLAKGAGGKECRQQDPDRFLPVRQRGKRQGVECERQIDDRHEPVEVRQTLKGNRFQSVIASIAMAA